MGTNYVIISLIQWLVLLLSERNIFRKTSGIPFIMGIWTINNQFNGLNLQFYVIPIIIYGLIISYISYQEGDKKKGAIIESDSYSFEMLVLFFQSIYEKTDLSKIIYGTILIGFSTFIIILGALRNKKEIWIAAAIFLFIELIVQFYQVITIIPWWAYVGFIGITLIIVSSYIIYNKSKNNQ